MKYRLTFGALAAGLAFFPSVEYRVLLTDGPHTEFRGFPLPWNSRSISGSLAQDVYIVPLLIDIIFFAAVAYFLWRWLAPRLSLATPLVRRSALAIVWAYGACCMLMALVSIFVLDLFPSAWYRFPISEIVGVQLHPSL